MAQIGRIQTKKVIITDRIFNEIKNPASIHITLWQALKLL